jgi:hypothetical protein
MQTQKEANQYLHKNHSVVMGAFLALLGGTGLGCAQPQPDRIVVTVDNGSIRPDYLYTYRATLVQNGLSVRPGPNFQWSISNSNLGTFTPRTDGTATFLGNLSGTATITATASDLIGTATVEVPIAGASSLTITAPNNPNPNPTLNITVGQRVQLTANAVLKDGTTADRTQAVGWRTSESDTVTVVNPLSPVDPPAPRVPVSGANKGRIEGVDVGTAIITAEFPDTGVNVSIVVNVTAAP